MRGRFVLLAAFAAALVSLLAFGGAAGAKSKAKVRAAGACAGNGVASSSPGFSAQGTTTASLSVTGNVRCQGTTSGAITASGTLTGNCNALKGSVTVSGALSGVVNVVTNGPVFRLTGVLNGHRFTAAGGFVPKTGNCVTVPLTSATIAFAGGFTQ